MVAGSGSASTTVPSGISGLGRTGSPRLMLAPWVTPIMNVLSVRELRDGSLCAADSGAARFTRSEHQR